MNLSVNSNMSSNLYFPNIRIMFPSMYESQQLVHDLARYYIVKITHWLNNNSYNGLLKYFVVSNGDVSFIDNKNHLDESDDKYKTEKKIKYFISKFLKFDNVLKLIDKLKYETGLMAHEFRANGKFIKSMIYNVFKKQFDKNLHN